MPIRKLRLTWLAMTGLSFLLSACTEIHIEANGEIRVEKGFGTVSIDISSHDGAVLSSVKGIGFIQQNGALSVGWIVSDQIYLSPTPPCFVVFFADGKDTAYRIEQSLREANVNLETICVVNGEKT